MLVTYPASDMTVIIGSSNSNPRNDENAVLRNVTKLIGHEDFDFAYMHNDIGLIKLFYPADISPKVQLVKLSENKPSSGKVCTALGWGSLQYFAAHETPTGPAAEILHKVDLSVISLSNCRRKMYKVTKQNICTYSPGKDACVGDSGGPLTCSGYQAGITSYGIGCAAKDKPGVFQRVDIHFKWLRAHGSAPRHQRPLPLALLLALPAAATFTTTLRLK